jgi:hypothetical protein
MAAPRANALIICQEKNLEQAKGPPIPNPAKGGISKVSEQTRTGLALF